MSDFDPYQSPKSDVANSDAEPAFRQGEFFVVKRDYIAPRVCFFTGDEVSADAKPMRVFMRKGLGTAYYSYLVITIFAIVLIEWEDISIWWAVLAVGIASLSAVVPGFFKLPSFQLFSEPKLRRRFMIRAVLGHVLSAIGLLLVLIGDLDQGVFLLGVILITGSLFLLKKPIKFTAKQGEYEQYEGAHSKFLDQLPSPEFSLEEQIKKNG